MVVDLSKLLESKDLELDGLESEMERLFNEFLDEAINYFEGWFDEKVFYYIESNPELTFSLGTAKLKNLKKELLLLLESTPEIIERAIIDKEKWWHLKDDRYEAQAPDLEFVQRCLASISDNTRAIENFPENAYLFYSNRGWSRRELGDYVGAIQDFTKAVQLNPNFAEAYSNLGVVRSQLGQYDEALAQCNKAIRLRPSDARTYYIRGLAFSNLGHYSQAITDFSKAVELNPQYANSYYNELLGIDLSQYGNILQNFIEERFKSIAGNVGAILEKYGYIAPINFESSNNPWYEPLGSNKILYNHEIPWSEGLQNTLKNYQILESKACDLVQKIILLEEECKKQDASYLWNSV